MLKQLSLRTRLTLMSAFVMVSVAILLTAMSLLSADRIFVQDLQQQLTSIKMSEGAYVVSDQPGSAQLETKQDFAVKPSEENVTTITQKTAPSMDDDSVAAIFSISVAKAGREFNLWGLVGLLFVTLLGTGATWFMAGHALEPVQELSSAIEEIGGSDFSRRVDTHDRQDEIGRLATSFNAMMDKVSASFARQKRFSASAAHELKTPLSTMQVGLEVLELDQHPSLARMEKALSVAKNNTERMIRLVDNLFRLSSDETCELCDEVSLDALFADLLTELAPLIQSKHLATSVKVPKEVRLIGNRTMLDRALFNLVENAAKYNQNGGLISLSAKQEEDAVTVQVSDTGIGMPSEELNHIFEPFYRVDRSRSRAVGGSGLGLALVKDIVERHHGTIQVESTPNVGTTFTLRFPLPTVNPEESNDL